MEAQEAKQIKLSESGQKDLETLEQILEKIKNQTPHFPAKDKEELKREVKESFDLD